MSQQSTLAMLLVTIVGTGLVTQAPTAPPAKHGAADTVSEIIVRFRQPPTESGLESLAEQLPAIVRWRALRHAPHPRNDRMGVHPLAFVRVAELRQADDVRHVAVELAALPGAPIVHAEPNSRIVPASTRGYPNDPMYSEQWGPQRIDAPGAWQFTTGSTSAVVAVIDGGLSFVHEEFQDDAIWRNAGEIPDNDVDDDLNGFVDDVVGWDFDHDDNCPCSGHHGDWMSGIIGARTNNGLGIAGLANVPLMTLEIHGQQSEVVEATYYAVDMGAKVVNYSLCGAGGEEMRLAIEYAWHGGVTTVGSAGNDNSQYVCFPARFPFIIAVGGTEADDTRRANSNYGLGLDLVAPGSDILSCARKVDGWYRVGGGTSQAAAHVTGVAALMYSIDPSLTPAETRGILLTTADDLGAPGFDEFFANGLVNARRAVEEVARQVQCPEDVEPDDVVDWHDLLAVLSRWESDDWRADIDDSGVVDFDDLVLILAAWGACE